MAAGDVYRLTIQALCQGQQYMNNYTIQMKSSLEPDNAGVFTLANAFKDIARVTQSNLVTYQTWTFRQLWGNGVEVLQDECRRDGGTVLVGNFTATNVGGVSTDMLPPQCAMVWTITTGLAGRRRRGRSYIFGLVEANQVAGTWSNAYLTTITTALNTIYGLYGPSGTDPQFQLGVWSERTASGCEYRGTPPELINVEVPHPENAYTTATGFTLRPTVFSQRRRTIGVGR